MVYQKSLYSWVGCHPPFLPNPKRVFCGSTEVDEPATGWGHQRTGASGQVCQGMSVWVWFSHIIFIFIWVFPKIVVSQNGRFIMENPIKNGWFGGNPIFGNTHFEDFTTKIAKKRLASIWPPSLCSFHPLFFPVSCDSSSISFKETPINTWESSCLEGIHIVEADGDGLHLGMLG